MQPDRPSWSAGESLPVTQTGCPRCAADRTECHTITDTLVFLDSSGKIVWINQPVPDVPLGAVVGRDNGDALHQDDRERAMHTIRQVIATGQPGWSVHRDLTGRYWHVRIHPSLAGDVAVVLQCRPICDVLMRLSEGQRKILRWLGDGQSVAWICQRYGISDSTVRTQLRRAASLLEMNHDQLVAWAGRMLHALLIREITKWR